MDGVGTYLLLVVFLALLEFTSAELCTEIYGGYSHEPRVRTFHCSFGCCGPDHDQYCCVSHAGVIVGIVFACIFGIAFLSACVCCFLKHHGARGRIVRPTAAAANQVDGTANTQTSVFIVANGTGPPPYQPSYFNGGFGSQTGTTPSSFEPKPPAYDEATGPPPAYSSPPPPPKYNDIIGGKQSGGEGEGGGSNT